MRVAVFASGGGSNFQSIVDAARDGRLRAEIVLCVSNRGDAGVLGRARRAGIPTLVCAPRDYEDESAYTQVVQKGLATHGVDFVALAGYMQKIPAALVATFANRMLNIHPALLPAFGGKGLYGMRVHRAVLEYGVRFTGVTVHLVDESYDTGPIVLQEPVPVLADDTPEELALRVLEVEHQIYPRALSLFADGRIRISGRRVHILDSKPS